MKQLVKYASVVVGIVCGIFLGIIGMMKYAEDTISALSDEENWI